jgi:His/Glu/Gln/Arg/opine family amino acid ABC transporter permease subunit
MELLNLDIVRDYSWVLLKGLGVTTGLTFVVILISLVLAIPVALARMSRSRLIRYPISVYVEVIRATPLLLQLTYIYYVFPSIGIRLDAVTSAILGLSLNYTAYMSEVYRGAIKSVPRSQWDAAASIGMHPAIAFLRIILPQAMRIATPTLGNYFISLFKDTALVSVVTVQDLSFTGQIIATRTYQYFTIFTLTGILYFSVGYPAALLVRYVEGALQRGYRHRRKIRPIPQPEGTA